jgi:hypothetical protein
MHPHYMSNKYFLFQMTIHNSGIDQKSTFIAPGIDKTAFNCHAYHSIDF